MLVEIVSFYALAVSTAPTNGQLMRELRTDQSAFDAADLNRDGRISDLEFDAYKRARRRGEGAGATGQLVATMDYNEDGALVPCEMYEDARCPSRPRKPQTAVQKDCSRTDGYYKVDDRNGTVYCPEY